MTEYFTNNSRPYVEQFNDGILLADAFDLTIYSSLPSMYADGSFNSNLNVDRLAGVSLVTMITNNNVTVTSTSLSGTGTITFRVYPNFALFEKWSKISWEADGDVSCSLAKIDGTPIGVNVVNGSALASNVELSKLQQIDVTFTLADATITSIVLEYSSNSRDRVVASVSKSNVTGLEDDLQSFKDFIDCLIARLDAGSIEDV